MTLCIVCVRKGPDDPGHDPDYERAYLCCARSAARMSTALHQIPGLCVEAASLGYVERDWRDAKVLYPAGHKRAGEQVPHFDPIANGLTAGPLNGPKGAPRVSGSPDARVPIRLDSTDLTAPARPASLWVVDKGRWPQDQIGHLAVATELEFWATDWADIRREQRPMPLVPELCEWLLNRLDWACQHHYALDEFAAKVGALYGSLMAAAGLFDAPPETVNAPCPQCHMLTLYRDRDAERIACGCCAVLMTEAEYETYSRTVIEENS